jgi:hypothetical protein
VLHGNAGQCFLTYIGNYCLVLLIPLKFLLAINTTLSCFLPGCDAVYDTMPVVWASTLKLSIHGTQTVEHPAYCCSSLACWWYPMHFPFHRLINQPKGIRSITSKGEDNEICNRAPQIKRQWHHVFIDTPYSRAFLWSPRWTDIREILLTEMFCMLTIEKNWDIYLYLYNKEYSWDVQHYNLCSSGQFRKSWLSSHWTPWPNLKDSFTLIFLSVGGYKFRPNAI